MDYEEETTLVILVDGLDTARGKKKKKKKLATHTDDGGRSLSSPV